MYSYVCGQRQTGRATRPCSRCPDSVHDLVSRIVRVILVDPLVEALVARIPLIDPLEDDGISHITISPIALNASAIAAPAAPIDHLVAPVEAVILRHSPVPSLIARIPLVPSHKPRRIPAIAIAGEALIILLRPAIPATVLGPSPAALGRSLRCIPLDAGRQSAPADGREKQQDHQRRSHDNYTALVHCRTSFRFHCTQEPKREGRRCVRATSGERELFAATDQSQALGGGLIDGLVELGGVGGKDFID